MGYKLLSVNSNPKIDKSNKIQKKYWSCIMHLRPVSTKICPYQDIAGCKTGCLNTAGLGGVYPSIQDARQKKTDLFLNDQEEFMRVLVKDIHTFIRACNRKDKLPAIRLNGTSDIQWEYIAIDGYENIFKMFPSVQFYDYTKIPTRKVEHIPNYHLTWSYSEANDKYAKLFDTVPNNKAVVFRTKDLPRMFKGLKVINGDTHDMRFLDTPNSVIGLKAKGQARKDTSGFVIDVLQIA
jgi:hypothetical protein